MANPFQRSRAEPLIRAVAADSKSPDPHWAEKIERLSEMVEYRVSATCIAMLGTAILAKALYPPVNVFWFKPTHVGQADSARAYSARTLCHGALVPLAAELGFSLGVSGREPLNNQPFFRMERLDDGTPVNPAAQGAFNYMMSLVREIDGIDDPAELRAALHAFVSVRRAHVREYSQAGAVGISTPLELITAMRGFMREGSGGGSHAQALAAGLMDAAFTTGRVDSGRINDPSRHYPGDVCVWENADKRKVLRTFEVRDKPVSVSDIHIFARRCRSDGVGRCGVLMVSPNQPGLDVREIMDWAGAIGVQLRIWSGWDAIVLESIFWSDNDDLAAIPSIAARIRERLIEAEVSQNSLALWDNLTASLPRSEL